MKKNRIETEQKYRIKSPYILRAFLKAIGARKVASGHELNEFFDYEGFLKAQGCGLRIRRYRGKARLTFKGPRLPGKWKRRLELEASISYPVIHRLLMMMGLHVSLRYAKDREIFRLGKTEIVLDRVRGHGWFLEIEGKSGAIEKISKQLGLRERDVEPRSYPQILSQKR